MRAQSYKHVDVTLHNLKQNFNNREIRLKFENDFSNYIIF